MDTHMILDEAENPQPMPEPLKRDQDIPAVPTPSLKRHLRSKLTLQVACLQVCQNNMAGDEKEDISYADIDMLNATVQVLTIQPSILHFRKYLET